MNKKKLWIVGIILVICIVIIGIFLSIYNFKITLMIGNAKVVIDRSTSTDLELTECQSETDIIVKKKGFFKVKLNDTVVKKRTNVGTIDIAKDNKIKVEVNLLFFGTRTYYINTMPNDLNYQTEGNSPYEGDYYLTSYYPLPNYILKLDESGKLLFYKKLDNIAYNFRKDIVDDEIIYSYLEKIDDEIKYSNDSYEPTKMVLMNENYEVIDEVRYLNQDGTIQPLENHGALILGKDHYILATVKEEQVNYIESLYTDKVANNLIEEVKDGKVIWQFETKNYPELYQYYIKDLFLDTNVYLDYAHYNSCTIDNLDNNLICSFRNINALLKIDRTNGKLMWILGGVGDQFGLTEEQKFAKQHSVNTLNDNSILIYNNDNYDTVSSIIKIKLDEANKKVIYYEKYELSANSYYMGSVQPVSEDEKTLLICNGGGTFHNVLEEIDTKTGQIYFSFNWPSNEQGYMYRAYKIK